MSSEKTIEPEEQRSQSISRSKKKPKNSTHNLKLLPPLTARRGKELEEESIEQLLASINYPAMPFHHLIPAALLALDSSFTEEGDSTLESRNSTVENKSFWHSLAARGVSAREAALFDDSIECSFFELVSNYLIQVDWEALHFNPLEGCSELYFSEMFLCKELIYKAEGGFPKSLEFTNDDLTEYLPEEVFSSLIENAAELFFNSLSANYSLTVSQIDFNLITFRNQKKPLLFSDLIKSHLTETASRIKGRKGREAATNGKQKRRHIVNLPDYWIDWQRAAQIAKFDFDFLRALDARAVRFYELTKLLRVPLNPINPKITIGTVDQMPALLPTVSQKLEIEYEKFASLMPLPRLKSEREIKRQINELIKPLRRGGYVKSFSIVPDARDIDRYARLKFRFND